MKAVPQYVPIKHMDPAMLEVLRGLMVLVRGGVSVGLRRVP